MTGGILERGKFTNDQQWVSDDDQYVRGMSADSCAVWILPWTITRTSVSSDLEAAPTEYEEQGRPA